MTERNGPKGPFPDIATKAELLQRLRERAKPAPQMHLTPDGWEAGEVRHQLNKFTERRIRHLETKLVKARNDLVNDLGRAEIRSHAKNSFEKVR